MGRHDEYSIDDLEKFVKRIGNAANGNFLHSYPMESSMEWKTVC